MIQPPARHSSAKAIDATWHRSALMVQVVTVNPRRCCHMPRRLVGFVWFPIQFTVFEAIYKG